MKEFFKEKLQIILFFILFYLLVEIVTFMWVGFSFLPKDIWIDLVIVFAISSLVFLIKSQKWSLFYVSIFAYLMILLFLVNATMYSVYYDLFTLQQLQLIGEAADVINFELLSIPVILITVGFIALYTVSLIFFSKYLKKKPREIPNYYAKGLATFFVSCLMIFGFFMLNIQSINAYVEDINVTTFRRASFQEYGVFAYYTKEITNMIDSGGNGDYVDLPVDYSEPTDYFGLLEGKNVVNILLESVQPFAINEVLTPNLYRLTQEGLYFENSYSENKTNYSELIGIIGNYPSIRLYPATNTYDFSYA
ncbi:MAG TPA: hypothetical protein PKU69_02180, partial [Bacillota bacterium]|nr:hypothetical protein [Bacillota bacterium]